MEDIIRVEGMAEELNCCLFAVSKMYVCTTNESCPLLRSRFGAIVKSSEVGLFKIFNMEEDNENRSKWIKVRLKPSEEELLNKRYKKSTFQNLSEYGRAMILGEPVTIIHRDRSMDEVLEELVLLRRELNFIGNNLNRL